MIAAVARWYDVRGIALRVTAGRSSTSPFVPAVMAGLVALVVAAGALLLHLVDAASGPGGVVLSVLVGLMLVVCYMVAAKPALLVFALLILFRSTIDRYAGYTVTFVDDIVVPLLFLIAVWQHRPWRTGRLVPLREAAVAAVVVLAVLSSLLNGVPLWVWAGGLLLMVKVVAFLYIAAWQDYTEADIRQFCWTVGAVALVVITLGYVETVNPQAFADFLGRERPPVPRGGLPSARSIFFHPVLYGWFSAFVALFLFAAYAVYRRWWMLLAGLVATAGVALSARRRAMLALLTGLFTAIAAEVRRPIDWRRLSRAWMPVGAGVLTLTILAAGLGDLVAMTEDRFLPGTGQPIESPAPGSTPMPTVPPEEQAGQLDAARLLLYRGSVTVAADHFPLGAGLGRYGSWMSTVEYSPLYYDLGFDRVWGLSPSHSAFVTDTFWPQILGEVGLFGLLAYLLFVALVGRDAWRAARAFRDRPLLLFFTLGALMVFANGLIETLASSMFHSPPRIYLLFGAVGISLALLRMKGQDRLAGERDQERIPERRRPG
jgi:hypothetical protein